MELSMDEIEERADALALKLIEGTTGRNEALLLGIQIEGLKDLALIKQVADNRSTWNATVGMRERELAAMESMAASVPKQGICGAQSKGVWTGSAYLPQTCRIPAGHQGWHESAQGMQWNEDQPTCPSRSRGSAPEECALPDGHAGRHESKGPGPLSWPADDPTKCGHRWRSFDDMQTEHWEICTRDPNHAGSHTNDVTGVRAVNTERTAGR